MNHDSGSNYHVSVCIIDVILQGVLPKRKRDNEKVSLTRLNQSEEVQEIQKHLFKDP